MHYPVRSFWGHKNLGYQQEIFQTLFLRKIISLPDPDAGMDELCL